MANEILGLVNKTTGVEVLDADARYVTTSGTPTLPSGATATTQTAGTNNKTLATTEFVATALGSVSGDSVKFTVTVSHSFTNSDVGKPIAKVGTSYALAQADSAANIEVVGVLVSQTTGSFVIQQSGKFAWLSHDYTGPVVLVSPSVAGGLTETTPVTAGQFIRPVYKVVDANTLEVIDYPAIEVAAPSSYSKSFVNADLTAGVLAVNHGLGQQVLHWSLSDNSSKIVAPTDLTFTDANNCSLDVSGFGTITGTWNLLLSRSGASGGGASIYGSVIRTSNYSVGAQNTWYDLTFDTNGELSGVTHSTTSNTERIYVTYAGVYNITARIACKRSGAAHHNVARLYKNGVAEIAGSFVMQALESGDTNEIQYLTITATATLSSNDYLTVQFGSSYVGVCVDVYDDGTLPNPTTSVYASLTITQASMFGSQGNSEWQLVERYTVSGSAVTSKTFSGLNGDSDRRYKIVSRMVSAYGSAVDILAQVTCGATTYNGGTDYYKHVLGGSTTTYASGADCSGFILGTLAGNKYLSTTSEIYATTGIPRMCMAQDCMFDASTISDIQLFQTILKNTTGNITAITVIGSNNCIGVGSYIELWKLGV